jgi:hypothetical protein
MKDIVMSSLKYSEVRPFPASRPASGTVRGFAAAVLHRASAELARLAHRLAGPVTPRRTALPALEFYADAGAPEGALYRDGQLVGWLAGVRRL